LLDGLWLKEGYTFALCDKCFRFRNAWDFNNIYYLIDTISGSMIVKPNVVKIRRISPKTGTDEEKAAGGTVVGFAGSTADAFTLLERLEGKLDEYPGQLARSCVELAKGWRTDKYLRRLEASLIVADASISLELSGNGDVLESHDDVLSVGSGSPYAKGEFGCAWYVWRPLTLYRPFMTHRLASAAARALMDTDMSAEEVAKKAMEIASDMCVYTNNNFKVEILDSKRAEK
jgi:ATP-dependent HslUV protease subunit HslV